MSSIVEQMLSNGYKEYSSSLTPENVTRSFQKAVKNRNGIKYFLECQEWDWRLLRGYPSSLDRFSYEFHAQFTLPNGKTFDVNTVGWSPSLIEVEQFFDKLWSSMHCQYYERYPKPVSKWRQKDLEEQIAEEKNAQK